MQLEDRKENRPSASAEEKTKKKDFGLPAGIVQQFEARGIGRAELANMEIDEILAQMKPLEGKALNKAIQTILKTTHKIEQLRSRLQMVTGWA
ncbi:uncharacterized protein NEMAJ01_2003, partial [Nematocida major]|uniref:uncharacterized protein n=1 Tax=Nematocida major TaxID=1912982 RepID=UPI0020081A4E